MADTFHDSSSPQGLPPRQDSAGFPAAGGSAAGSTPPANRPPGDHPLDDDRWDADVDIHLDVEADDASPPPRFDDPQDNLRCDADVDSYLDADADAAPPHSFDDPHDYDRCDSDVEIDLDAQASAVNAGSAPEQLSFARPATPAGQDPAPLPSPLAGPVRTPRHGRRLALPQPAPAFTPQQRLLILDSWQRSGLPAGEFAPLVGISKHTLYAWKKRFDRQGPAGLLDQPKGGPQGSRPDELTKRTILLLRQSHPDWGCQKISDHLLRGPALPASPSAVARVLHEAGYQLEETPTRPHADHVRHFERAQPNQLWQTDLFTFVLKRQNRRVYLVAFLDDHSRFLVGYGLHASQSTALVLEVLRAAIAGHGQPEEILTDNGGQYVTWRGTSAFRKELDKRGIKQIVAAPRRPQTLGKIERFWGTLWRECVESAVFIDLADAQRRIGLFIDHYNFQRPHQGIGGLTPADRFYNAAAQVKEVLRARVAAHALELARQGVPKAPFYLTGQVGGQAVSVHAEGERVILRRGDQERQEIDLTPPPAARPVELPAVVCPQGVVSGLGTMAANADPAAPGGAGGDELSGPAEEGGRS